MDDTLLEQQRAAYAVKGVDESEPVQAGRKRKKAGYVNGEEVCLQFHYFCEVPVWIGQKGLPWEVQQTDLTLSSLQDIGGRHKKKPAPAKAPTERKNTAIYITGLPTDADVEEIQQVFSRCGVIAEEIDGQNKRIKMYKDEEGNFKGDALIMYFKPESVTLAVQMLDDSQFRSVLWNVIREKGALSKITLGEKLTEMIRNEQARRRFQHESLHRRLLLQTAKGRVCGRSERQGRKRHDEGEEQDHQEDAEVE